MKPHDIKLDLDTSSDRVLAAAEKPETDLLPVLARRHKLAKLHKTHLPDPNF